MRIALISDLHGNEVALKAVIDDIEEVGVDQTICLGDVATLGPRPGAVLTMLRERGYPCILGNHDAFMLEPGLIHTYTEAPVVVAAVDWCRSQLKKDEIEYIRTFHQRMEFSLDARSTLLLFHGSPRSHMEDLLATTPPDALDELLAGHSATVMAGGHTHIQMLRQHRGMLLVNPGSVGIPFKEYVAGRPPTLMGYAEYATVEARRGGVSVHLRRVPLDRSALRDAAAAAFDFPLRGMMMEQYS